MHATMPRPVPVPPLAVVRAMLAMAAALAAGGLLVFVVVGSSWWAVAAGAFACACGVVLGSTEHRSLALALGLASVAALGIALGVDDREPVTQLAFPARATLETAPPVARPHPTATPVPARPGAAARRLVTSYYAALDAGDYERAWSRLAPAIRTTFGGFDAWRAGYATTLGHEIEDLRVDGATISHVLVAADRTPCGGVTERRFAVSWRLDNGRVADLRATKLSGTDPAAAC